MKELTISRSGRIGLLVAAFAVSGAALSACSPTYGTGTPAGEQLFEDVSSMASFGPKQQQHIDYKPRPDLVKPENTEVLPPPQENVASSDNPEWPESPEQRLARIRADATANRDKPGFKPDVVYDLDPAAGADVQAKEEASCLRCVADVSASSAGAAARRAEINKRLAERKQGSATQRRYLSEPPVDYRVPAASAPSGDVGEDEWKKEREARRAAREKSGKHSWRDLVPWL